MKRVHTTEADTCREDGQAPEALPVGEDAKREFELLFAQIKNRKAVISCLLVLRDSAYSEAPPPAGAPVSP